MKLHVHVHDQPVATLESTDGFRHVMSYHPDVAAEQFVSLLMPVRTESYAYPELHPLFRMNLPEGFLLSILQEQLGPHVGASPLNLLAVVGRNAIGRVKVTTPGADPTQPPLPFDLNGLLRGDNSEAAFVDLVRRHAASGVSGVVPKFLSPNTLGQHGKGTLATERYIVKGTTSRLPGVALNEHLCMAVSRQAGIPTAATEVSDDGQALVVHRFDFEADGTTRKGMEDLCSLLALRPEQKYESTWERVAARIKDVTPAAQQNAALSRLADLLLLTYALRNADCHTKNIALLYSSRDDIELAPVYDMLTITVYDDFANNPPGMPVDGRSTWMPGKALERFLQTRCHVMPAQTRERVERICEAIVQVTPQVVAAAQRYPAFRETGKRMLQAWNDGMNSLRLQKAWSLPTLDVSMAGAGFSAAKPGKPAKAEKIGRSPLLGRR
ncbi:type II toxin-antitoxin system HipA family toxin [Roseateles sp. LYH14W]|uniref:Type II toxin-antitoxin system HipA family toxin n=1 Tax=Pelomonas parva TaxID=3299032 RepID=A0ABW7EZN3_9BURK